MDLKRFLSNFDSSIAMVYLLHPRILLLSWSKESSKVIFCKWCIIKSTYHRIIYRQISEALNMRLCFISFIEPNSISNQPHNKNHKFAVNWMACESHWSFSWYCWVLERGIANPKTQCTPIPSRFGVSAGRTQLQLYQWWRSSHPHHILLLFHQNIEKSLDDSDFVWLWV